MLEKYSHEGLIQLAEQVALRYSVGESRLTKLGNLMLALKFSVNWRVSVYSKDALQRLWDSVVMNYGDGEVILSMTSEFVFRAQLVDRDNGHVADSSVYSIMAASLSWPKRATAVSEEISTYTAEQSAYLTLLKSNPWVTFLYLLSMSDALEKSSLASSTFAKSLNQPRTT